MLSLESVVTKYQDALPELTLCFLVRDNEVLLGFKKTGFGKGNTIGIGGKVEAGELPIEAAIREVEEEVFISPADLKLSAVLDFYFPYVEKPRSWNQRVFVYIAKQWTGMEAESDEISPAWYSIGDLPFQNMWDDNRYWLEGILGGEKLWAQFTFNQELKVEDWKKRELSIYAQLIERGSNCKQC